MINKLIIPLWKYGDTERTRMNCVRQKLYGLTSLLMIKASGRRGRSESEGGGSKKLLLNVVKHQDATRHNVAAVASERKYTVAGFMK